MPLLLTRVALHQARALDTQFAHTLSTRLAPTSDHRLLFRIDAHDGRYLTFLSARPLPLRRLGANLERSREDPYDPPLDGTDIEFAVRLPAAARIKGRLSHDLSEDAAFEMLERRAQDAGFDVGTATLTRERFLIGKYHEGQTGLSTVDVRGTLTVTDPDRYLQALTGGVGRKRSYGYGLLLTGPASRIARSVPWT